MWASNLKENDTAPVLEHVKKLLSKFYIEELEFHGYMLMTIVEPGGYIQWEDADLVNQAVSGDEAQSFAHMMRDIFTQAGLQYE